MTTTMLTLAQAHALAGEAPVDGARQGDGR